MTRIWTEAEILKFVPKIENDTQYQSYKERAINGEGFIGGRWNDTNPEVQKLIMLYTFLMARMLEYMEGKEDDKTK